MAELPANSSWPSAAEASSPAGAKAAIRSYNNYFGRARTIVPWAVELDGKLIGFVKLFGIECRSRAEIGYWIGKRHWSKGYGTEAVAAATQFAFSQLGLHRVFAMTDRSNLASQGLLEKVGFQREGCLRQHSLRCGEWRDSLVYGLLRDDALPKTVR